VFASCLYAIHTYWLINIRVKKSSSQR
jgi:hypothetical protein